MAITENFRSLQEPPPSPEKSTEILTPYGSYGICYAEKVISNDAIGLLGTKTASGEDLSAYAIKKRTWIDNRYEVGVKQDVVSMGIDALKKALRGRRHLGALLVSTTYPIGIDVAKAIQEGAGISCEYMLNIHAGCAGSGIASAFYYQNIDIFKKGEDVAILATEDHSKHVQKLENNVNPDGNRIDPALSYILFSGGAGANVYKKGEGIEIVNSLVYKSEEFSNLIKIAHDKRLLTSPFLKEIDGIGDDGEECTIELTGSESILGIIEQQGTDVIRILQAKIPGLVEQVLKGTGLTLSDVNRIITHQPSGKVIGEIAVALNTYVDPPPPLGPGFESNGRYIKNKDVTHLPPLFNGISEGNWSSVSGIKAEKEAIESGWIKKGDMVMHIDFGWAGLIVLTLKKFG